MIDLGKWASGAYVISTPINDPESGGEAEYTERPALPRPSPAQHAIAIGAGDAIEQCTPRSEP